MKIFAAYTVALVGLVAVSTLWPRVVAAVYAVTGGLVLLALAVHWVRSLMGLR